jgi:hypothetical protein
MYFLEGRVELKERASEVKKKGTISGGLKTFVKNSFESLIFLAIR